MSHANDKRIMKNAVMQTLLKGSKQWSDKKEDIDRFVYQTIRDLGESDVKWKDWPADAYTGTNPVYKQIY